MLASSKRGYTTAFENLEFRRLLDSAGGACLPTLDETASVSALDVGVEPQFVVHQTPRLQPGNAPLIGTPSYTGSDQVDILWQTITIGTGESDSFAVRYRRLHTNDSWQAAPLNPFVVTGDDTRIVHSASATGLVWDADYEYQVQHFRGDQILATYQHRFHTRLASGDTRPFQFIAYGDSATRPPSLPPHPDSDFLNFQQVQTRVNAMNPDFGVLLGDNAYFSGRHRELDARFSPTVHPGGAEWVAGHIDYLGIGNHDGGYWISTDRGEPSRQSVSVPQSVADENAYASPPAGEFKEFNYSFDYGNTHFLTLDMNAVELRNDDGRPIVEELWDYAVTDLNASQAQWKVVYFHQPLLGTEKPHGNPDGYFFQTGLTSLLEAGADLLLVGDSHNFAWTHALTGFEDRDQNGVVTDDEVDFVRDTDRTYEKDVGLIQVVAGVGGRSLRSHPFSEPFVGSAFSVDEGTGPIEYGFAYVEVTQDRLTVSYISAETGQVVGDTNGNGFADAGETHFGRFQILDPSVFRGDLNADDSLNAIDIDLLSAALRANDPDPRFDMNLDAVNDAADYDMMLDSILGAPRGDANLDRLFDSTDLVEILAAGKYEDPTAETAGWSEGDWNGDGLFDSADLVLALQQSDYRG